MISNTDKKFFCKARQVATVSDYYKTQVGCIAVYQGNVVALGCNTNKTHPIQKFYNRYRITKDNESFLLPKMHAEINCINSLHNLDIPYGKVKLYIYRIRKDQPFGMSRPCPSCMAAIHDIGIKHIYYTTNDGYAYENLSNKNSKAVSA